MYIDIYVHFLSGLLAESRFEISAIVYYTLSKFFKFDATLPLTKIGNNR